MLIQQVKIYDQVSSLESVRKNLFLARDCFGNDTLNWLCSITKNPNNHFKVAELAHRLTLDPGEDHARLQELGQAIVPALNKITGLDLNFMEAKCWLDLPDFGCQTHSDAEHIVVSFQVYLDVKFNNADDPCCGVEFLHDGDPFVVPPEPNVGYINVNTDLKPHRVQAGFGIRNSVIFQYNLV